jgi:predicted AlkP superfamily phosphohydrolase/phosphomutase
MAPLSVRHLPGRLRDYLQVHWANARIDWSQTRAFHLPTDLFGCIRINLKRREPQGIVEPGSEYDRVCSQIADELKKMIDPQTGARVVREVYHTDQIYPGPQRHRLPDLLVSWQDEPEAHEAHPEAFGRRNGDSPDARSGNHRPEGFAIFYRPGMNNDYLSSGHIVDIAPTILNYFGLKPPATIDGHNLIENFC